MKDRIDKAMKIYNLRRKLLAIEKKRGSSIIPKFDKLIADTTNVTPVWFEVLICIIISPVLILCLIFAGFKWLYLKIRSHAT